MKFCPKAGANLFSLTCKLLKGKKIKSDHQINIMVKSSNGDIIFDCTSKTHDGWVARIDFLCESSQERAQSATALYRKNINDLHVELDDPSKAITHATTKAINIHVTSTFKPCEDCTLGNAQKSRVGKGCSLKIFRRKVFL